MTHTVQPKKLRFLRFLFNSVLCGLVIGTFIFAYLWLTTPVYPSFEVYQRAHQPSDIQVSDRNGKPLHRLRVNFQVRQGEWLALENISPALTRALIVTEDKRFYDHWGVDPKAVLAAVWNHLRNHPARGASTLSMQLVGLMDERIAPSGKRSLWQKIQQAVAAFVLEKTWEKDQILEAYLNTVPLRGENVGITAGTQNLLNKHPNGINEEEAAMMVALIRSPNASESRVENRACTILQQMHAMNADDACAHLKHMMHVYFAKPQPAPSQGIAPHLAQHLRNSITQKHDVIPPIIHISIDAQIQQRALESLQHHLRENRHRNIEDGAIIVLDNQTGEILVWVGSSGADFSQAQEVDAATAFRQPGSTLKPFLYAQAIEEERLTAASLLHDAPLNLNIGGALYVPQNYDRQYKGWVSVRTALGSSLNIPAVRTIVMLGVDSFAKTLLDFGLPLRNSGDYYGYSLALGSAEITLLSLTNAYRSLANRGHVSSVLWQTPTQEIPELSREALPLKAHSSRISPETAWIIGSILSDRQARVSTFGLDNELNTRYWSAVKTGTSKDMRDNWAIGYSRSYTVGVWVGNASGASMWGVSGTSGATPVWRDIMNFLYERDLRTGYAHLWEAPPKPEHVIEQPIKYAPAIEPARKEWFLQGTEQSTIRLNPPQQATGTELARIMEPVDGMIVALDPDIPPDNQRIILLSNSNDVIWALNRPENILGTGSKIAWLPVPGRHLILLNTPDGNLLDQIRIEVRGAHIARK